MFTLGRSRNEWKETYCPHLRRWIRTIACVCCVNHLNSQWPNCGVVWTAPPDALCSEYILNRLPVHGVKIVSDEFHFLVFSCCFRVQKYSHLASDTLLCYIFCETQTQMWTVRICPRCLCVSFRIGHGKVKKKKKNWFTQNEHVGHQLFLETEKACSGLKENPRLVLHSWNGFLFVWGIGNESYYINNCACTVCPYLQKIFWISWLKVCVFQRTVLNWHKCFEK